MKTNHPKIEKAMDLAFDARQRSLNLLDCLGATPSKPEMEVNVLTVLGGGGGGQLRSTTGMPSPRIPT